MLLEYVDFGFETRALHLIAGALLGLVFGIAAQVSRFCLRRAVAGPRDERASAGAVWLTALASAIAAFWLASSAGLIDISDHRILSGDLPIAALVLGGLAFGAGMILTRGCVSRLTVLSGTGNLRAIVVLLTFAVTAHATLKGVLAPLRTGIGSVSVEVPFHSLAELPLGGALLLLPAAAAAVFLAWRARVGALNIFLGAVIGVVAVGGWMLTSVLLLDDFDPQPVQSAAFTLPWSDTLFWVIASSAIPAGFGVGFIAGVLGGSFVSAGLRGELRLETFESSRQTLRYVAGGVLMGVGGVLAGGCTVGAGLSGVASGSLAALIALASIAFGGWIAAGSLHLRQVDPATA